MAVEPAYIGPLIGRLRHGFVALWVGSKGRCEGAAPGHVATASALAFGCGGGGCPLGKACRVSQEGLMGALGHPTMNYGPIGPPPSNWKCLPLSGFRGSAKQLGSRDSGLFRSVQARGRGHSQEVLGCVEHSFTFGPLGSRPDGSL